MRRRRPWSRCANTLAPNLWRYERNGAILYQLTGKNYSFDIYYSIVVQQLATISTFPELSADATATFAYYAQRWQHFRAYPLPVVTVIAPRAVKRGTRVGISVTVSSIYRSAPFIVTQTVDHEESCSGVRDTGSCERCQVRGDLPRGQHENDLHGHSRQRSVGEPVRRGGRGQDGALSLGHPDRMVSPTLGHCPTIRPPGCRPTPPPTCSTGLSTRWCYTWSTGRWPVGHYRISVHLYSHPVPGETGRSFVAENVHPFEVF